MALERICSEATQADSGGRREILRQLVDRYAREVTGHFNAQVYGLATA